MTELRVDDMLGAYLKLRAVRSALKKEYDRKDEVYKAQMEDITDQLLITMDGSGTTRLGSVEAGASTFIQESEFYKIADYPIFKAWVEECGRLDMLQARVNNSTVAAFTKDAGHLPPGLSAFCERKAVVRVAN